MTTVNTVEELADLVDATLHHNVALLAAKGEPGRVWVAYQPEFNDEGDPRVLLGSNPYEDENPDEFTGVYPGEWLFPATVLVPAPAPTGTEACESRNADCGPVVWHDGDGTAMCAKCLIATVAENTAALSARPAPTDTEREAVAQAVSDALREHWLSPGDCVGTLEPRSCCGQIASDAALSATRPATVSAEQVGDIAYGILWELRERGLIESINDCRDAVNECTEKGLRAAGIEVTA